MERLPCLATEAPAPAATIAAAVERLKRSRPRPPGPQVSSKGARSGGDLPHTRAQRRDGSGDLLGRLAAGGDAEQHGALLGLGGFSVHQVAEGGLCRRARKRPPGSDFLERSGHVRRHRLRLTAVIPSEARNLPPESPARVDPSGPSAPRDDIAVVRKVIAQLRLRGSLPAASRPAASARIRGETERRKWACPDGPGP